MQIIYIMKVWKDRDYFDSTHYRAIVVHLLTPIKAQLNKNRSLQPRKYGFTS